MNATEERDDGGSGDVAGGEERKRVCLSRGEGSGCGGRELGLVGSCGVELEGWLDLPGLRCRSTCWQGGGCGLIGGCYGPYFPTFEQGIG